MLSTYPRHFGRSDADHTQWLRAPDRRPTFVQAIPTYAFPLTRSRLPAPAYPFPLRRLKRDTHERSLRRKRRARFPSEWQPQPSLPRSSCFADLVLLRRGLSSAVADGNVLVQRLSLDLIVSTLPCDGAALTHAEKARLSCHGSRGLPAAASRCPAAASRCIHSQAARHCVGCMDARARGHAGGGVCCGPTAGAVETL